MTKTEITKLVLKTVVGIGTAKVTSSMIKNNVNTENIADKVTVGSASVVIGYMAAEATESYTDRKVDEVVAWWNTNVKNA